MNTTKKPERTIGKRSNRTRLYVEVNHDMKTYSPNSYKTLATDR